jgi:DNA-directed RNA polymerase subunit A"
MNVTVGLPRIIEILDGRKEIQTPMMEIYLKSPYSKGEDIRKLALSIKETTLKEIATGFSINVSEGTITVSLDREKMKLIGVTTAGITANLAKQLKGVKIKDSDGGIEIKVKESENVNEVYKVKEKIKNIYVEGIKGIKQVLPVRRGDEFIIITAGSNLKEIFKLKEVDATRTTTNDVFEIEKVFGIEAARQAIINEVFKVIEAQGLNVDIRHIMLVSDTMCYTGEIKGITRYGIVSEKASVLARASFETPLKHIINAALVGEVDKLDSVVENVMLNQPVPVGTGLPGLVTKVKK